MQQMMTFAPLQPKSRPADFGFRFGTRLKVKRTELSPLLKSYLTRRPLYEPLWRRSNLGVRRLRSRVSLAAIGAAERPPSSGAEKLCIFKSVSRRSMNALRLVFEPSLERLI